MRMYHIILTTCMLMVANCIFAQQQTKAKADKLYKNFGFSIAVEEYKAKAENKELDIGTMIKLANSYRLTGDTWNTEYWYSQVIEGDNKPIYRLHYAQALQSNGKYKEAKKWFLEYDNMVRTYASTDKENAFIDTRGAKLAAVCDQVANFKDMEGVEIKKLENVNSEKLDFSPVYYKNGIVFSSTRGLKKQSHNIDKWINDNFMDLFFAEIKVDGTLSEPIEFSEKLNTKLHEGPLTFTKDEKTVYFTRNNYNRGRKGKDKEGVISLKIYSAQFDAAINDWRGVRELPFNGDEKMICHPTLSANGSELYFAADLPNGFGGLDIYVSKLINGAWGKPENLGSKVNGLGNEVFPFIHDDGTLYFASNGHEGLGGLDIYYTQKVELEEDFAWTKPQNMGKPFNTSKDDFGLIMDLTRTSGFLTSNRVGGKGSDDIYSFRIPIGTRLEGINEAERFEMDICVYDAQTNEKVRGATVFVSEQFMKLDNEQSAEDFMNVMNNKTSKTDAPSQYFSNGKGLIQHRVREKYRYVFRVQKDGYKMSDYEFVVDQPITEKNSSFCIPLNRFDCMEVKGKVSNKKFKNNLAGASVKILNQCTGEEITLTSDVNGEFNICLACNCDYIVVGHKKFFIKDLKMISTTSGDCSGMQNVNLSLFPDDFKKDAKTMALNDPNNSLIWSSIDVKKEDEFAEGMIIQLDKIFYDFNKSYIRNDAKVDLDELVELLSKYPSMEVELSSHTDARGSNVYNKSLSQKRAEEAVNYIIREGIIASRITAKGYGEERLRNSCKDGATCSEKEHQMNRRTEVKITKFNKPNKMKIKYNDTRPSVIDKKSGATER